MTKTYLQKFFIAWVVATLAAVPGQMLISAGSSMGISSISAIGTIMTFIGFIAIFPQVFYSWKIWRTGGQ